MNSPKKKKSTHLNIPENRYNIYRLFVIASDWKNDKCPSAVDGKINGGIVI